MLVARAGVTVRPLLRFSSTSSRGDDAERQLEASMRKSLGVPPVSAVLRRRQPSEPLLARAAGSAPLLFSTQHDDTGAAVSGLVFDGRQLLRQPADLAQVYAWLQPRMPRLTASGRVVLVAGRPSTTPPLWSATLQQGLVGFARSLGKEYGRQGVTCNVLLPDNSEQPLDSDPTLQFLLSPSAAFVSGETLDASSGLAPPSPPSAPCSALVTGAAQGIGAAIADTLAHSVSSSFASVLAVDRSLPDAGSSRLVHRQVDVCHTDALLDCIGQHVADTGAPLSALVLNAGITRDRLLRNMTAADFQQVLDVNLLSITALLERLLAPGSAPSPLLASRCSVVLLSSINGIAGAAGQTNYATTKSALIGLVNSWAPALRQRGGTINCVAPGFIDTMMTRAMPPQHRLMGALTNALVQAGQPQDIANVVEFLCQHAAVTGQTVRVCGLHMTGR